MNYEILMQLQQAASEEEKVLDSHRRLFKGAAARRGGGCARGGGAALVRCQDSHSTPENKLYQPVVRHCAIILAS